MAKSKDFQVKDVGALKIRHQFTFATTLKHLQPPDWESMTEMPQEVVWYLMCKSAQEAGWFEPDMSAEEVDNLDYETAEKLGQDISARYLELKKIDPNSS